MRGNDWEDQATRVAGRPEEYPDFEDDEWYIEWTFEEFPTEEFPTEEFPTEEFPTEEPTP